jgi:hypothetical protein
MKMTAASRSTVTTLLIAGVVALLAPKTLTGVVAHADPLTVIKCVGAQSVDVYDYDYSRSFVEVFVHNDCGSDAAIRIHWYRWPPSHDRLRKVFQVSAQGTASDHDSGDAPIPVEYVKVTSATKNVMVDARSVTYYSDGRVIERQILCARSIAAPDSLFAGRG